jgi:hypothetical protein
MADFLGQEGSQSCCRGLSEGDAQVIRIEIKQSSGPFVHGKDAASAVLPFYQDFLRNIRT